MAARHSTLPAPLVAGQAVEGQALGTGARKGPRHPLRWPSVLRSRTSGQFDSDGDVEKRLVEVVRTTQKTAVSYWNVDKAAQ